MGDLKNARNTDPDDRFEEAMGAFCSEARSQCATLMTMGTKMERLYAELSEYYVFDKLKYTLEEFFGDIKTFKDQCKRQPGGSDGQPAGGSQDWHCLLKRSEEEKSS